MKLAYDFRMRLKSVTKYVTVCYKICYKIFIVCECNCTSYKIKYAIWMEYLNYYCRK